MLQGTGKGDLLEYNKAIACPNNPYPKLSFPGEITIDGVNTFTANAFSDLDQALKQVALKGTDEFEIDGSLADDLNNLKLDSLLTNAKLKEVSQSPQQKIKYY